MADFRKWFFAFAVVALLLGLGSTANAQIGLSGPTFSCTANAAVPPVVRAEGLTELVGDLTLNCTGGSPTPRGNAIPLSNVTVFLNAAVTSRLIGPSSLSEATLMIDEPHAVLGTTNSPIPNNITPVSGSPRQVLCGGPEYPANGQGAACPVTGTFVGVPSVSPYDFDTRAADELGPTANVFSGVQNSASSIIWLGVPIDAPGTAGERVIRVTNVRVALGSSLGVSSTFVPTSVTMFIAINGSQQVAINGQQQTVAVVQLGLITGNGTASFLQCISNEEDLATGNSNVPAGGPSFKVKLLEGFPSSFKRRNIALSADGVAAPNPIQQNVPGFAYNTETGFYAPGLFTATPIVGLADTGTKFLLTFNNLGAGVHIFVKTQVPLVPSGSGEDDVDDCPDACSAPPQPPPDVAPGIGYGVLDLVSGDINGNGGSLSGAASDAGETVAEVNYSGTTGYATFEVVNSDPTVIEQANVDVWVAYVSATSQNLPAPGSSTVTASFAPISTVAVASSSAPIPRFTNLSSPSSAFSINLCTCNLLMPFVTNQAGFDTGVALANTSLDTFGTSAQQGTVLLTYFGSTAGGGAAPPPFTSQTVPAGQELIFNLSSGGNFGVPATPGFEGYIIATANFQYCHAFVFISDVGAQKLAEGYLAIQLDEPFSLVGGATCGGSRTCVSGENMAH